MLDPCGLWELAPPSAQFSFADFGDVRLTKRLCVLADALAARPSDSFPQSMRTEASLEGAYRFMNNRRVTPERILEPHVLATFDRAATAGTFLALHDTTQFEFDDPAQRHALGILGGSAGRGFLSHVTLAVSADLAHRPLGVLAIRSWLRDGKKSQQSSVQRRDADDNELLRWTAQAIAVDDASPAGTRAIHVMDREADSYSLLTSLAGHQFVIRAKHDRVVLLPEENRVTRRDKLKAVVARGALVLERTVPLSRRLPSTKPYGKHIHPARHERNARLGISATAVVLRRSKDSNPKLPATLAINVVNVVELDTAAGNHPVHWVLLTSLPIETAEDVAAIVDHYRARWIVEEFFKALKTGCAIEQRHFESLHALLNVLATMTPIAHQLLLLRYLSRHCPDDPATAAITPTQLAVLREFTVVKLSKQPTVRHVMLAIAQLGGHLRNNGEPGWQVLGRGFHDLLLLEEGWSARRGKTM